MPVLEFYKDKERGLLDPQIFERARQVAEELAKVDQLKSSQFRNYFAELRALENRFQKERKGDEALAFARERGLPWRLLVWGKPDPRPRPTGPVYAFEPVLALRPLPGRGRDLYLASSPRPGRDGEATGHPHQKPVGVMAWLVELASRPGEVVLDPFMGSGSTGEAALRLGRGFIGVEREPSWYEVARKRLQSTLLQAPLLSAPTGGGGAG
jgi:site-specific DNA-methyltransferase (adenine-specific)